MMFKNRPSKKRPDKLESKWSMREEFFTEPTAKELDEIVRLVNAKNHFDALGVHPDDDLDEQESKLRDHYLQKCRLLNPNQCEHPKLLKAFEKLSTAYDVLGDPKKRAAHRREVLGLPAISEVNPFEDLFLGALGGGLLPIGGPFGPSRRLILQPQGLPGRVIVRNGPNPGRRIPLEPFGLFRMPPHPLFSNDDDDDEPPAPRRRRNVNNDRRRRQTEVDDDDEGDLTDLFSGPFLGLGPRRTRRQPSSPLSALLHAFASGMDDTPNIRSNEPQQRIRRVQSFSEELNQLREMGFSNESRNREVLQRFHGDLNAAVDYLTTH